MAEPIQVDGTFIIGNIPKSNFGDVEKNR